MGVCTVGKTRRRHVYYAVPLLVAFRTSRGTSVAMVRWRILPKLTPINTIRHYRRTHALVRKWNSLVTRDMRYIRGQFLTSRSQANSALLFELYLRPHHLLSLYLKGLNATTIRELEFSPIQIHFRPFRTTPFSLSSQLMEFPTSQHLSLTPRSENQTEYLTATAVAKSISMCISVCQWPTTFPCFIGDKLRPTSDYISRLAPLRDAYPLS